MSSTNNTTPIADKAEQTDITKLAEGFDQRGAVRASWLAGKTVVRKSAKAIGLSVAVGGDAIASFVLEAAPSVAEDANNAAKTLAHEMHNATREFMDFVGYDPSVSLAENNRRADEKAKDQKALKLAKKNLRRAGEGKDPVVVKDHAWYVQEIARINKKAEETLAAKKAQQQPGQQN